MYVHVGVKEGSGEWFVYARMHMCHQDYAHTVAQDSHWEDVMHAQDKMPCLYWHVRAGNMSQSRLDHSGTDLEGSSLRQKGEDSH